MNQELLVRQKNLQCENLPGEAFRRVILCADRDLTLQLTKPDRQHKSPNLSWTDEQLWRGEGHTTPSAADSGATCVNGRRRIVRDMPD